MRDYREYLPESTILQTAGGRFVITGALGRGGGALIYSVETSDSKASFAVKEDFPILMGVSEYEKLYFRRGKDGKIQIEKPGFDEQMLEYLEERKKLFALEIVKGQKIEAKHKVTCVQTLKVLDVKKVILPSGEEYVPDNSFAELIDAREGAGCFLNDLIDRYRKEGKWNIYTIATIMQRVIRVVKNLHESGWIHLDLQPGNIVFKMVDDDSFGDAYLMDFGTAEELRHDGYTKNNLNENPKYSTPFFMPPEITRKGILRVDARADVYSLTSIFLYMLIDMDEDAFYSALKYGITLTYPDGEKIAASSDNVKYIRRIISKGLAKNPERRFSLTELLNCINQLIKMTRPSEFRLKEYKPSPDYFRDWVDGSRTVDENIIKDKINYYDVVYVTGFGGIGKTALVNHILSKSRKRLYKAIFKGSFRQLILELDFGDKFYSFVKERNMTERDEYAERLDLLGTGEYKDAILFIDNFDSTSETYKQLISSPSYNDLISAFGKVIITSRFAIKGEHVHNLGRLDKEYIISLFYGITSNSVLEKDKVVELSERLGNNTLAIILCAYTIKNSKRKHIAIEDLLYAINENCLDDVSTRKVDLFINDSYYSATIVEQLNCIFNLSIMAECEQAVLKCASLADEGGIDETYFLNALPEEDVYEDTYNDLVDTRWIDVCNGIVTVHPLIKTVLATNEKTKGYTQNAINSIRHFLVSTIENTNKDVFYQLDNANISRVVNMCISFVLSNIVKNEYYIMRILEKSIEVGMKKEAVCFVDNYILKAITSNDKMLLIKMLSVRDRIFDDKMCENTTIVTKEQCNSYLQNVTNLIDRGWLVSLGNETNASFEQLESKEGADRIISNDELPLRYGFTTDLWKDESGIYQLNCNFVFRDVNGKGDVYRVIGAIYFDEVEIFDLFPYYFQNILCHNGAWSDREPGLVNTLLSRYGTYILKLKKNKNAIWSGNNFKESMLHYALMLARGVLECGYELNFYDVSRIYGFMNEVEDNFLRKYEYNASEWNELSYKEKSDMLPRIGEELIVTLIEFMFYKNILWRKITHSNTKSKMLEWLMELCRNRLPNNKYLLIQMMFYEVELLIDNKQTEEALSAAKKLLKEVKKTYPSNSSVLADVIYLFAQINYEIHNNGIKASNALAVAGQFYRNANDYGHYYGNTLGLMMKHYFRTEQYYLVFQTYMQFCINKNNRLFEAGYSITYGFLLMSYSLLKIAEGQCETELNDSMIKDIGNIFSLYLHSPLEEDIIDKLFVEYKSSAFDLAAIQERCRKIDEFINSFYSEDYLNVSTRINVVNKIEKGNIEILDYLKKYEYMKIYGDNILETIKDLERLFITLPPYRQSIWGNKYDEMYEKKIKNMQRIIQIKRIFL